MSESCEPVPSVISIVGVDGSGKTTLANWLKDELSACGREPVLVWSRFRNYLSKPLLALTRLTGHNHYRTLDGVRFGFHDFESLVGYRELFAVLQAVDVNIAAYSRIYRQRARSDIVLCERGPWDTLVDVTADTGLAWLPASRLGRIYSLMIRRNASVLWVSRDQDKIIKTRPELKHDYKLPKRIALYSQLAALYNWHIIDNNGSLAATQSQMLEALGMAGHTPVASGVIRSAGGNES